MTTSERSAVEHPAQSLPEATRLDVWERAAGPGPLARDLALLEGAFPEAGRETLAGLGIGRRDAALLEVYRATYGPWLEGVLDCAACGTALELSIDASLLSAGEGPAAPPGGWTAIEVEGYELHFRLPDSADLMATAAAGSPDAGRAELTARVLRAWRDGEPVAACDLPPRILGEALEAMSAHDPLAETLVDTTCPSCGATCVALLDAGTFLWARIEADARTLLGEVDTLARAYGWSEREILALGARRRGAYLDLVR